MLTGMTIMAAKVFIDTNILLNAAFSQRDNHLVCQQELHTLASQEDTELWINGQVIREFLRVATNLESEGKKLELSEIRYHLNRYLVLCHVVDETMAVIANLLRLWHELSIRGKAIHDANIVATMLAADIPTLLSLDDDFRRYTDHIEWRTPSAESST